MVNVNDSGGNLHSHNQLDAELQKELQEALGDKSVEQLMDEDAASPAPSEAAPAPDGAQAAEPRISHDMVRGRITAVRGDDVFVEISGLGGKNQGVVPLTQFDRPPRLGSIMDFVVQRLDEAEGLVILSREGAVTRSTWEQLQRGSVVEARVVAQNKGGLELEMVGGIRAFMPASQIDMHHVDDLSTYVGQRVTAMVQDIDRKSKKVVLSRRHFLEHERAVKQAKIWEQLAVGQTLDGKVTSIVEYGAFVDIGGADGLVHISDMSYSRLDKPGNLVTIGQDVKVKVLKLDQEKKRISLGMKQITPDPWEGIAGRIRAGEQISGRVLRLAEFGAFVEVLPGVEGLLPMSEMTWRRSAKANETVKEGDVIRLAVLTVDPEKRRLTLSLKQAGGDPWMGASHKYPRMALVDATVLSTTDFGAFVEIEPGVEGLVHISEMSDRRITAVTDIMKVGDKHQVRVLEVDEDNRRIRLSLKAVKEPPKEQTPAPATPAEVKQPAKPRKPGKALKGGMEHGALGQGLGQIKL